MYKRMHISCTLASSDRDTRNAGRSCGQLAADVRASMMWALVFDRSRNFASSSAIAGTFRKAIHFSKPARSSQIISVTNVVPGRLVKVSEDLEYD